MQKVTKQAKYLLINFIQNTNLFKVQIGYKIVQKGTFGQANTVFYKVINLLPLIE